MVTRIFDEPSKQPLPDEPGLADHRASVIKGAISAIPLIGGVLGEELGLVLAPALTRRRDAWFSDLARRLAELENRVQGFDLRHLSADESFVSAVVETTQSALKTNASEKIEALRNAASILPWAPLPVRIFSRSFCG
jgi:hypothetical protein